MKNKPQKSEKNLIFTGRLRRPVNETTFTDRVMVAFALAIPSSVIVIVIVFFVGIQFPDAGALVILALCWSLSFFLYIRKEKFFWLAFAVSFTVLILGIMLFSLRYPSSDDWTIPQIAKNTVLLMSLPLLWFVALEGLGIHVFDKHVKQISWLMAFFDFSANLYDKKLDPVLSFVQEKFLGKQSTFQIPEEVHALAKQLGFGDFKMAYWRFRKRKTKKGTHEALRKKILHVLVIIGIASFIVFIVGAVIVASTASFGVTIYYRDQVSYGTFYCFLIAMITLTLAISIPRGHTADLPKLVSIFDDGFIIQSEDVNQLIYFGWKDIKYFWRGILERPSSTSGGVALHDYAYRLERHDGYEYAMELSETNFMNPRKLGDYIDDMVSPILFEESLRTFNTGASLMFGPFTVGQEGIHKGGADALSWSECKGIFVDESSFHIKKKGRFGNWSSGTIATIPNFTVFYSLIKSEALS